MTNDQHSRMRQAARHLLDLSQTGTAVDALAVQWARKVLASKGPAARVAFQREKILAVLRSAPPQGMTAVQIRQVCDMSANTCNFTLHCMVERGLTARLMVHGRSRYFTDIEALEVGRPLVAAEEREREFARMPPPKPKPEPKPQPEPEPHVEPRAKRAIKVRGGGSSSSGGGGGGGGGGAPMRWAPAPRTPPAALPDGVPVTVLPSHLGARFQVREPVEGIGAMAEWLRRRSLELPA